MYEQPFNPYQQNVTAVKDYFKNGRVLTMGILYIVSLVLNLVSTIFMMNNSGMIFNYAMNLFSQINPQLYEQINSQIGTAQLESMASSASGSIFTIACSCIITGLFIAAYLIIYFKSRNNDPNSTPRAGFTILQVFAVLSLIGMILATLIVIVAVIGFYAIAELSMQRGSATTTLPDGTTVDARNIMTILSVVMLVIGALTIFFGLFTTINRVRYIGSVKKSLTTVQLQSGGAKPYGVMCIILGVLSAIGVLGSIVSVLGTGPLMPLMLLLAISNLISTVMLFIEGSIALGYKKHIDNYLYGYNNTPYGGVQDPSYVVPIADNGSNPYAPPVQQYNNDYADYNVPQQPTPNYDPSYVVPADDQQTYRDSYEQAVGTQQKTCPNCGAPVGDYPFCDNCGTKL